MAPRRAVSAALLSAAVAIATGLYGCNAAVLQASDCAPQPDAAKKIDAAAVGQLAALNGTGTGRGYADLAFTDATGKPMTLKDFAGKALLVNFWASWCIPCRAEMPALDDLAAAQNDNGFVVLTINTAEAQQGKAEEFFKSGNWPHLPLLIDDKFAVLDRLKTAAVSLGLPTSLLLDKRGCELGVIQGPAEWDSADGTRLIETLKSL
jgi:thiol-disulfide isomerase/thioredoxin